MVQPGVFLECVLPVKGKKELVHCIQEVSADGAAGCNLPMVDRLYPDEELKGHCYLTDGDGGAKITKDAWFAVQNRYSGPPPAEVVTSVAKESKKLKTVKTKKAEKVEEKSKEEKEKEIDEAAIAQQKEESGAKKGGGAIMGSNGWFILFLLIVIAAIGGGLIYLKSKRSAA